MSNAATIQTAAVLKPADFLSHWQGHRRLTRRVIEVFPDDQLFTFSIGGMRPFGALAWEMQMMAEYTLHGLLTDEWTAPDWSNRPPPERAPLLAAWDATTERIDTSLPTAPNRFAEVKDMPWGGPMPVWVAAMYSVDNEIHHRGQGYVYLRALGIEPPAFYER